ncbi:MAG: HAMP domain-containing histidine kinase [Anaerolineae bacterium]|nr:HAMP domain-containing histidine kinase [Anaerolineae bacterium]NUQ06652.1 HAMP domain-containing histidine kinase [Anaerolineae bacterium]
MRPLSLSLVQRAALVFGLLLLLVVLSSGTGLFFSRSIDQSIGASTTALDQIDSAAGLESAWFQVVASIDNMLLTRQTNVIEGRLAEQIAVFNMRLGSLQTLQMGSSAEAVEAHSRLVTSLTGLAEDLNQMVDELFSLAQAGSWTRAQALRHTELASLQRRFSEDLADFQANIRQDADEAVTGTAELRDVTLRGWILVSILAVIIGSAAAFLTGRGIINQINQLVISAYAIQQGDLTRRVAGSRVPELNVMAESFNAMTGQLTGSIQTLEQNVAALERSNQERARLIKELEDALLFKDQFLATMSHELRTPLNAVLGYAAIIQEDEVLDEDVRYMVSRMEGNSVRLLNLINDILDISRINANRIEIVARPVDLRTLAQTWQHDFSREAENKGLDFQLEIDPALPPKIVGDEERLTQITANLLQNAFKFTPHGYIKLGVTRDADRFKITVEDSGEGIPETWHHLIFDEFRQVDMGSRRKHGGAGLGLSIVKKLCLLMGGNVTVSSKLDVGSTFTVTLPLRTPQEVEALAAPAGAVVREEFADVANTART